MPPTPQQVFLDDLARAGVTDLMAEVPFNRFEAAPAEKAAPKPAPEPRHEAAPAASEKAAPEKPETPEKPIESKKSAAPFDADTCLRLHRGGSGIMLVVPVADSATLARSTVVEKDLMPLFEKMMAAIDVNIQQLGWLRVAEKGADGLDHDSARRAVLRDGAFERLKEAQPDTILILGQFALKTLMGEEATLAAMREETHTLDGKMVSATYHPRTLVEQPVLKRLAWRDLLNFQSNLNMIGK